MRRFSPSANTLAQYASYVVAVIFVLLPFHALFTTWLGSHFGHLDLFRIWKELLIVVLLPIATYLVWVNPQLRLWIKKNWLPRLIFGYTVLSMVLGLLARAAGRVNSVALIYGLLANLRYLGFFLLTFVLASHSAMLKQHWRKLVLMPGIIVVVFGLLQRTLLPYDFLRHFGYGPTTIPAYQTVDQKIQYQRIQSTLKGANPLGAYLVVLVTLILGLKAKRRWLQAVTLVATLVVLFFTYSRSAYIGAAMSAVLLLYWRMQKTTWRQTITVLTAGVVVVAGLSIVALRHNRVVENTFFHTDNTSKSSQSSNAGRATALKGGLHDIIHEPLGRGPGTAGPESVRNNHPARLAENYYLQIGQEVGIAGLVLFLAINVVVAQALWLRRADPLARILLASLVGITCINLLSHAWSDDTLALLWWGLGGLALAPDILKQKKYGHSKEKTA